MKFHGILSLEALLIHVTQYASDSLKYDTHLFQGIALGKVRKK